MKVIELFAGIGSQTQALKNIGVEHEVVGIAEIDKYAVRSYEAIHGDVNNLGDICKIEKLPHCDLLTYSFPCQDLSVAGKGAGIKEGTRSGLLLEVERLLEVSDKPKYLLMENVKNLVGKKNKPDFDRWCKKLESMGYTSYWKVLNAKHYGIPQNRERVFMMSIFGEHEPYIFPEGFDNEVRIEDIVEDVVDDEFYLSEERIKMIKNWKAQQKPLTRILGKESISPTLTARGTGEYHSGMVLFSENFPNTTNYEAIINEHSKIICEQRTDEGLRFFKDNVCGTLRTIDSCGDKRVIELMYSNYRIRKLTPLECWRLMGFEDEHFLKAKSVGMSNRQLYKQAGNSIVVDVLEYIFSNLFIKN